MAKTNSPKIQGKHFLRALESIQLILHRKTYNEMTDSEKIISDIVSSIVCNAYLYKKTISQ